MVIGGFAVIALGVKRMTTDVDLAIQGDAVDVEAVVEALGIEGVVARIDDPIAFARANLVLLMRDRATGVGVDISFAWSAFEREALARRDVRLLGRARLPVARAEDLVVYKAIAGRPHDMEDAEKLLLLHPRVDRKRIRRCVEELAAIAEDPEILERLEDLLNRRVRVR